MTADDFLDSLTASLRDAHVGRVGAPINVPTATGAFPSASLVEPRLVVPDANVLRNDLLYACRQRQRTTLVNGANSGFLRLFCAQHVVAEVWEHSNQWSETKNVDPTDFRNRWQSEYLPLIRVVPDASLSAAWLSPAETVRLDRLAAIDSDDIPSARLSLLLGAYFLTNDELARAAVYGTPSSAAYRDWLSVLKAGSNAGQLGAMFETVVLLTLAMGRGAGPRHALGRSHDRPLGRHSG